MSYMLPPGHRRQEIAETHTIKHRDIAQDRIDIGPRKMVGVFGVSDVVPPIEGLGQYTIWV